MQRYLLFVFVVLLQYLLVSSQVSPGFNLARLLQERTNRLQQLMLQSLQSQGASSSPTTGVTSPRSGAVTGTSSFIPINQLLQQQRNLQSQLLQNVRTFQQALQSGQSTQTRTDNTLPGQQANSGNNNFAIVDNSRRSDGTGINQGVQTRPSPTPAGSASSMFTSGITGNNSVGGPFNTLAGLGFPSTSGTFWTQRFPTSNDQTGIGRASTSGITPTSSSTFGTGTRNPETSGATFGQTSGIQSTSGSTFGQFPGSSDSSGTPFSQPSGTPGTSFSSFGQTSGTPGFTLPNDLSSTFNSVFNSDFTTGLGNTFPSGTGNSAGATGNDFTSVLTTGSTQQSIPTTQPALQCTAEYQKMPGHTLCMTDSQLVTNSGVTPDDKQRIVFLHNQLRARVQPPAEDLMKLQWDERLAAVADKWARQCTLAHDKERRITDLGMTIGQNVAVGYEDWQQAIQQWYNEIRLYRYGFDPDSYLGPDGWRQVAHFTQIVQNGTYMIGCGFALCPATEYIRFFVCNYASGQSDLATPYTAGTQCGQCVNNCVNGLCDCGDLVCVNKGRLNPGTCTCECPKPYKGRRCEILDCPPTDNWICGRDWPASFCDKFYNVPEECPIMCGLCKGSPNVPDNTPATPNTTFVSAYGCRYRGARDTIDTCKTYGDNGADMKMCATEGGSVGCGECDRYFNIKKDYCPVMCGLCDAPCAGKRCYNGGTLDTRTCSCQCRRPFTGDICDYAQCPVNGDPAFCRFWPQRYCSQYFNVPEECPYMCGICKPDTMLPSSGKTGSEPQSMRTTEGNEAR